MDENFNCIAELTQDDKGQLHGGFELQTSQEADSEFFEDNGNCQSGGWFDSNGNCNSCTCS